MSADRTTEILNYLSAISREVGELRTEMREMRAEQNSLRTELAEVRAEQSKLRVDLDAVRADTRMIIKQLDRIGAVVLENRADIRDVEDRVAVLEGKQS
ncbi:MAG: hypothetical protein ACR2LC_17065 [Pyrinomonadaceae bacterium]